MSQSNIDSKIFLHRLPLHTDDWLISQCGQLYISHQQNDQIPPFHTKLMNTLSDGVLKLLLLSRGPVCQGLEDFKCPQPHPSDLPSQLLFSPFNPFLFCVLSLSVFVHRTSNISELRVSLFKKNVVITLIVCNLR